ncbi:hypothetical protein N7513_011663 [Penicillium frequentans]|nr:hypothetical protein N7513_011663 [Penicillium glabrum]
MCGQKILLRAETKPAEAQSACESLACLKRNFFLGKEELAAYQRPGDSDSYDLQGFDRCRVPSDHRALFAKYL